MTYNGSSNGSNGSSNGSHNGSRNGWHSPRWEGISRAYKADDVYSLRGTVRVEHSLARAGAEKLWAGTVVT